MNYLMLSCLITSFTTFIYADDEIYYWFVDDYGNPVPKNTFEPQVVYPQQWYPYSWPVQSSYPPQVVYPQVVYPQQLYPYSWPVQSSYPRPQKEKAYAQHSQSDVVGDPYRPCEQNEFQCTNPKQCIPQIQRCDNRADCVDVSDEIDCECTTRLTQDKFCDFYADCPNGEDEIQCFGCSKDEYYCFNNETEFKESGGVSHCYNLKEKCDKKRDCFNGKDENECIQISKELLSPTDSMVPTTENGILYYMEHDQIYPVCSDTYDLLTRYACQTTLSHNFRDVEIKYEDTNYSGNFVTHEFIYPHSTTSIVDSCTSKNSSNSSNVVRRVNCLSHISCGIQLRRFEKENFSRMSGGHDAIPGSNPWLVGIFVNGSFTCGGSIIGDKWVLTAAHCLHDDNIKFSTLDYIEVRAGLQRMFSFSSNEQAVRVNRAAIHSGYVEKTEENDIALLELESALAFNSWVQPICLPTQEHVGDSTNWNWQKGPEPGTICRIAGWGDKTSLSNHQVDRQQELDVPIVPKCNNNTSKVICAGYEDGGYGACYGDSGGPLVCESRANGHVLYLAGIVSTAYEFNESASEERTLKVQCGEKNVYGQFTGLTWYIDWINERQTDMADEEMWKVFRDSCPGVKCTQSNRCAFRDGNFDCINGRDECP